MKKDELIPLLIEGFTFEEVSNLTKLSKIKGMIENLNFDDETKNKLNSMFDELRNDTLKHVETFSDMIKDVEKSKKDEY